MHGTGKVPAKVTLGSTRLSGQSEDGGGSRS